MAWPRSRSPCTRKSWRVSVLAAKSSLPSYFPQLLLFRPRRVSSPVLGRETYRHTVTYIEFIRYLKASVWLVLIMLIDVKSSTYYLYWLLITFCKFAIDSDTLFIEGSYITDWTVSEVYLILFTNMTLSTLLIRAACRMRAIRTSW